MPAADNSSFPWLRNVFVRPRPWQEALIFFVGIGGTIAIGYAARGLSLVQQTVIWAFLLLALAVAGRQGWLKLFGPVLFYDLVRTTRQSRYFLIRIVYTSFLFALLAWLYELWDVDIHRRAGGFRATDLAAFAASFFYTFMGVQFVIVALLTPASTAGAIAEEKERRTLEFLLATDLDNREIVLSKLLSRLLNIVFLILAGLPILSILQFVGGVDPGLVLAGFAATGLTAASLAGLSIFYSTVSKRARDAILLTYLTAFAYLVLSSAMGGLSAALPGAWSMFPSTATWTSPITVQDLMEWFNAGNFIAALIELSTLVGGGGHLEDVLPGRLFQYAVFHGLVAATGPLWAVWRLRTVAVKETYGKAPRQSFRLRLFGRPRVSDRPMLWKEIFAEPGLRFHWLARIALLLLFVASFLPPAIILGKYFFGEQQPRYLSILGGYEWIRRVLNDWVRIVGAAAACLALLGVAVRAAGSISGERDHKTFDELLVTPLTSKEILAAKWAGSILNVRWAWVWLGLIWLVGLATGGLHMAAVPLLLAAWLVYAAAFASIGLWCSMVCRTTLRAVVWTLLAVLMLSAGHWLIMALACYIPLNTTSPSSVRDFEWLMKLQAGLTPPFVLAYLAFFDQEIHRWSDSFVEMLIFSIFGVAVWAAFAAVLWSRTNKRFRLITGRTERIQPRFETSSSSTSPPVSPTVVATERENRC